MSTQEREDFDDNFAKEAQFPLVIYPAAGIWVVAGCLMVVYSMACVLAEFSNKIIDIFIIGRCLLCFVVGIAGGSLGVKYVGGVPKTTRLIGVGSITVTILCCLALVANVIYFFQTPIVRIVGSARSNFLNDLLILLVITITSCVTTVLVHYGSTDYRIWKEHQLAKIK